MLGFNYMLTDTLYFKNSLLIFPLVLKSNYQFRAADNANFCQKSNI